MKQMGETHAHFEGKDAIAHVIEAQAKGLASSTELHGAEIPGHLSAACDAAKETAIVLVITWIILSHSQLHFTQELLSLSVISLAWLIWKTGRSAWLGWSRLERLHRVLLQEKWEIEHHRSQEREELKELYHAKGFEGKLLDDVVDVLMANGDRLLKVMVEEELGLSLETQEHPLKQALGATVGTLLAVLLCAAGLLIYPEIGLLIAALLAVALATGASAKYERNNLTPAIIWNLGIAIITFATAYYLAEFLIT